MQFLIVDIDLAHLWLHSLPSLLLQTHPCFLFLDGVSLVSDTGIGDPGCSELELSRNLCVGLTRQLEGRLLDTSFAL